jgi:amino acid adenylation domain-containing protein
MGWNIEQFLSVSAGRHPDKTAVCHGATKLSYRELEARAEGIATSVQAKGCGRDSLIGICLHKSCDFVAAIFGVLRAGAAYVPLDPEAPPDRLRRIVNHCELSGVIVGSKAPEDSPVATRRSWSIAELTHPSDETRMAQRSEPTADSLAYVLYTSGSTGQPKGVAISHRACRAFLDWSLTEFGLTERDHFLSLAPFNFDLSVFDIFNSIRSGGTLHLVPPTLSLLPKKLADYVFEHEITIWYSVPWVISNLVELGKLERYIDSCWPVRLMLFAGEVFPIQQLKRAVVALSPARFYNLFGPTETNVCTFYELPPQIEQLTEPVPIGQACSGDEICLIDDDEQPVKEGEIGQLLVSGDSLMSGYWRMPEATAEVLVAQLPGLGTGPFYRTGDFVSRLPDGNLKFHGRRDSLIKRRGYRIELGEIEQAARQLPGIDEVAAVASYHDAGTMIRLFAAPKGDHSSAEVRHFLTERIPLYMLPDRIELLHGFPRTPNGKIDRAKLTKS